MALFRLTDKGERWLKIVQHLISVQSYTYALLLRDIHCYIFFFYMLFVNSQIQWTYFLWFIFQINYHVCSAYSVVFILVGLIFLPTTLRKKE